MKKKLIMVIAIVAVMLFVFSAGCVGTVEERSYTKNDRYDKTIEKSFYDLLQDTKFIVDKDTKVMYLYVKPSSDGSREITPLYNADGTLKLYDPETCRYKTVYFF